MLREQRSDSDLIAILRVLCSICHDEKGRNTSPIKQIKMMQTRETMFFVDMTNILSLSACVSVCRARGIMGSKRSVLRMETDTDIQRGG